MLCIVCSRPIPIPIYRDENKLCKSCASQIKLKDNLMKDVCTDSDLDNVQRQLLLDLNLDEDSDYEAELNYLREAKRTIVLQKEKNLQSFHPNSSVERLQDVPNDRIDKLKTRSSNILAKECGAPQNSNDPKCVDHIHQQDSLSCSQLGVSSKINQKLCDCSQPIKEKVKRRVMINRGVKHAIVSVKKLDEHPNHSLDGSVFLACRAVFRATDKHTEPTPQFEKIHSIEKSDLITSAPKQTTGNRNPFICPVTFCKNIIPVSDLIKHFKLNHIRVPIVPVVAGACTNLFWETKVDQFGATQCLMLLLTACKFNEIANFKDSLPIAVMTTKVKLSDLAADECNRDDDRHFYLIWLTAMTSSNEPVHYTITAWNGLDDGRVHVVNTSQSYSIRADQHPKMVYRSGMVMLLTAEQIKRLSNGNQDMVKLQVVVH